MEMIFSYLQDAMVALVAAAVCATIAVLALWKLFSDLRSNRKTCAWNKDPLQPAEGGTRWICATCGSLSLGDDKAAPTVCRKNEQRQPA